MAIQWCRRVDGVSIFPKLPVYLRTYETEWKRNRAAREAATKAAEGVKTLTRVNTITMPRPSAVEEDASGAAPAASGGSGRGGWLQVPQT